MEKSEKLLQTPSKNNNDDEVATTSSSKGKSIEFEKGLDLSS